MHRIQPDRPHRLHTLAATRALEQQGLSALPAHTLMRRAGLAVARLALALAPHARTVWLACGRGNNGGDGLEAACQLRRLGLHAVVSWLGSPESASADSLASWQAALQAGVRFQDEPPELQAGDLCIDALFGIGLTPSPTGAPARADDARLAAWIAALNHSPAPTLAIDLPSGLSTDQGQPVLAAGQVRADHTLSLLTLKPGLFTAEGRDHAGQVWLDTLGLAEDPTPAEAWLSGPPAATRRRHASHKGSYGDVQVLGGEHLAWRGLGMGGAAVLAARAALHGGAGRVLLALLDPPGVLRPGFDPGQPELMLRDPEALDLEAATLVCGCGGGVAIEPWLAPALARAPRLVLDADALNALAGQRSGPAMLRERAARGQATVLTPHPLEAARLLQTGVREVQADRLRAAQALAQASGAVVVLKGSGSVIAAAGRPPHINPTGNARLATAGTGDVLAGLIGARWAAGEDAFEAACSAVFLHGRAADHWPADQAFSAGALAQALGGLGA